ncbi:FAD-binding and (Fe-S)-binding domain-containing protein [Xanthocytophaga flava]|uniref:FAD-binding and (Fe-S)-binding domain-containing protein n=1 Tax=Xanthocytophaga flava TaxID=3048013 RepID=UPI0028D01AE0|nr:FAD-linked oxidase C-terminal domain-containing protein [Xanthocytophaga flavus]MDJ1469877.1 FAD-linked oxidase C-terminal domain-containing protein [Xanthocytophaga flavus]
MITEKLRSLSAQIEGEFYSDNTIRTLYATDASAYREMPLAVAIPKSVEDLKKLIAFARKEKVALIPRTAGTSLAGQVVGSGLVVDMSKYLNKILEINVEERWVRVQPGVVRDELNLFLKEYGLYFGPETSTANRAMIGGMVGNNSCGSNSVVYGSTREHLISAKALLSDGSEVDFHELSIDEFEAKCLGVPATGTVPRGFKPKDDLETKLYRSVQEILSNEENAQEIRSQFPKRSIARRNTGYALDLLLETEPFTPGSPAFNFCKLIAGSEGTLAFLTEIKLNILPLPPKVAGLVCVHFNTIDEALKANLIALKYNPSASELIDHYILECTKENIEQSKNRFFVQGDPGAILVVEIAREDKDEVARLAAEMEAEMRASGLGYHFPVLYGEDTKKIWTLRKAGLGLLTNMPGDAKPVAVIEDTAIDVNDLPDYIRDFNQILEKYGLYSVHYAHAGSGELHLRPIINLKTEEGNQLFRKIAEEIALLVKKYDGSLSGEHGDGRLRGEFIPWMVGEKNYQLFKQLKQTWDPDNIFNPGKIVDTPPMNEFLRYTPGQKNPEIKTIFNFTREQGILRHAEQCNGSGDCRKTQLSGGTMCPSYMATRNEKDTTRARANILREFLTNSTKENPFDHEEIKEVMDLCLSCKGCKSECPSNVDMGKLKAEFLQHYYDANGVPMRSKLIGNFSKLSGIASVMPWAYNLVFKTPSLRRIANNIVGFHPDRTMPLLASTTLKSWHSKRKTVASGRRVYLFCDEFTNFNDVEIGKKGILLLEKLGYEVIIPKHVESGRAYLSKGLLRKGKEIAEQNVQLLKNTITEETPLIGIEPSAILTFRDEYPELVSEGMQADAQKLAKNVFLIDEFLAKELDKGNLKRNQFTQEKRLIKLHGHCQQKAVGSLVPTKKILSLPANYEVHLIPSGCCGMAGSFGYEKEHYDISMKIGELVLFPTVRKQPEDVIIAAPGTSCRHQIHDGTHRKALHPVEILYQALV